MSDFMTRREFGAALKLSPKTLRRYERDGIGPKPVRLGSRIARYPVSALAEMAALVSAAKGGAR